MNNEHVVWDKARPFIMPVKVTAEHIDSYRHVNNSVYLKWMDECARAHSLAVGIDCDQAFDFGYGMAVRESRVTYFVVAHEADNLSVGVWVAANDGKLRIQREFQIIRLADQATLIRAQIDYVCINVRTGKPAKMPIEFRKRYDVL